MLPTSFPGSELYSMNAPCYSSNVILPDTPYPRSLSTSISSPPLPQNPVPGGCDVAQQLTCCSLHLFSSGRRYDWARAETLTCLKGPEAAFKGMQCLFPKESTMHVKQKSCLLLLPNANTPGCPNCGSGGHPAGCS